MLNDNFLNKLLLEPIGVKSDYFGEDLELLQGQ